jgi:putative membrane protein
MVGGVERERMEEREEGKSGGRKRWSRGESLLIFLKGVFMGSADIVPGVSGGTIALITGIYERLIDAIRYAFSLVSRKTAGQFLRLRFREIGSRIRSIDWQLLVPLVLGIVTAILVLSNLIHHLMNSYPVSTYAFFFGLILGSALYIYRKLDGITWKSVVAAIAGFLLSFTIIGLGALGATHTPLVIFGSGAVAISAMVLPGISGAFILVLLNQYEYVLGAIKDVQIRTILIFAAGAFTGLFLFSRLLSYLLHRHENVTKSFLVGLMLGSLRLQVEMVAQTDMTILSSALALLFVVGGFALVISIDIFAERKSHVKG